MSTPTTTPAIATLPDEAHQFDFWLGNWDVSWEGGSGTNTIQSVLDGRAIQENFKSHAEADGTPGLHGISLSVFDTACQQWRQTWVDNTGGYLDFMGAFQDGKMMLTTERIVNDQHTTLRMVWYDIEANHLEWNWERRNADGKTDGETWQVLWHITYRRANAPAS